MIVSNIYWDNSNNSLNITNKIYSYINYGKFIGNEKNKLGKIVAVGKGYYSVTGTWINTILKVGDTIILPTMGFSKLEHEGEEYWIGPENQVLGRLVDENFQVELPF